MTVRRGLGLLLLVWLVAPAVSACPLCYGGDDPETGRATLWAGAFLVATVYGVLSTGALWAWRRVRSARSDGGTGGRP